MTQLDLLAADTAMGAVTLNVSHLDRMVTFYRDGIGLDVQPDDGSGGVVLGRASVPVIVLHPAPALAPATLGSAGLYHTAILFGSKQSLAASVYSTAQYLAAQPASGRETNARFVGSSDHGVSEAFYFSDPEGNGVELYADRDRSTWTWSNGTVAMKTDYLDPNAYLRDNVTEQIDVTSPVAVGHVHLSVGDIAQAREFYVDRLGFEQTAAFGEQALFVSAGGYHHHMAMNTWNSAGAGQRSRALGLGSIDIRVPSLDDLRALEERMLGFRVPVHNDELSLEFDDPWRNLVRVTTHG